MESYPRPRAELYLLIVEHELVITLTFDKQNIFPSPAHKALSFTPDINIMNMFLAPTGAQEMLMLVRSKFV